MPQALSKIPGWLAILLMLTACASTTITRRQAYTGGQLPRPGHIFVYDFGATPEDVPPASALARRTVPHRTAQTSEEIATGRRLGAEVARQLVAEIQSMGLPAVSASSGIRPRPGDLLIRGYFVSVNPGDSEQRMLVGFCSCAAELRTSVEGYEMTRNGPKLLGSGETDAQGDKTPGMLAGVAGLAVTGNPVGLLLGGASKVSGENSGSDTIEGSARRTAQDIGQALKVKFQEQGWI